MDERASAAWNDGQLCADGGERSTITGCSRETAMLAMVLEQLSQLSIENEKLFSDEM